MSNDGFVRAPVSGAGGAEQGIGKEEDLQHREKVWRNVGCYQKDSEATEVLSLPQRLVVGIPGLLEL